MKSGLICWNAPSSLTELTSDILMHKYNMYSSLYILVNMLLMTAVILCGRPARRGLFWIHNFLSSCNRVTGYLSVISNKYIHYSVSIWQLWIRMLMRVLKNFSFIFFVFESNFRQIYFVFPYLCFIICTSSVTYRTKASVKSAVISSPSIVSKIIWPYQSPQFFSKQKKKLVSTESKLGSGWQDAKYKRY